MAMEEATYDSCSIPLKIQTLWHLTHTYDHCCVSQSHRIPFGEVNAGSWIRLTTMLTNSSINWRDSLRNWGKENHKMGAKLTERTPPLRTETLGSVGGCKSRTTCLFLTFLLTPGWKQLDCQSNQVIKWTKGQNLGLSTFLSPPTLGDLFLFWIPELAASIPLASTWHPSSGRWVSVDENVCACVRAKIYQ